MGSVVLAGMVARECPDPRLAPLATVCATRRLTLLGFFLGLAFWAAALFAVAVFPGRAYRLLGTRWDRPTLGYTADAAVAGYADAGFAQWLHGSPLSASAGGSDIEIRVRPLAPPIFYEGQPAQANLDQQGTRIVHCEVRLDPDFFFRLSEAGRQNTVTHEIGHCLGLNHSDQPGIMMNPLLYSFSADDAAGLAAIYGSATASLSPVPAAATPRAAAADARPMAPPLRLESGWNLVTWDGAESEPSACGCTWVYALVGGSWQHWSATGPGYANSLQRLRAGVAYWALVQ